MRNSYFIKPKHGSSKGIAARVAGAIERLPLPLVRKSSLRFIL